MSLTKEIAQFCQDLILGEFEETPSNAALVVGGLISLIPVVDQIMDVRDVCAMVYRTNKIGVKNCKTDHWVDFAITAVDVIPTVGSLFKGAVKPLWKNRRIWKFSTQRGQALIERSLGLSKGAIIKYFKAFNWAQYTQLAIEQAMNALDLCDKLLAELSVPRWWVPDSLEGLARNLRPGLKEVRAHLRQGIQKGMQALRDFLNEMLGEDGAAVAVMAHAVVGRMVNPHAERAKGKAGASKSGSAQSNKKRDPYPEKATTKKTHGKVQGSERQQQDKDKASRTRRITRSTAQALDVLSFPVRGLAGEHISDYHHMAHYLGQPNAWPHGHTRGSFSGGIGIVKDGKRPQRALQIVKADLAQVTSHGIDTIWQKGSTLHFVEAKTTLNYYALVNNRGTRSRPAPRSLSGKHAALWYMLKPTQHKGVQMSKEWVRKSKPLSLGMPAVDSNLQNRYVHLTLFAPCDAAGAFKGHPGPMPKAPTAAQLLDTGKHIQLAAKVFLDQVDETDISLHDEHKTSHLVTQTFTAADIELVTDSKNRFGKDRSTGSNKKSKGKGR